MMSTYEEGAAEDEKEDKKEKEEKNDKRDNKDDIKKKRASTERR